MYYLGFMSRWSEKITHLPQTLLISYIKMTYKKTTFLCKLTKQAVGVNTMN